MLLVIFNAAVTGILVIISLSMKTILMYISESIFRVHNTIGRCDVKGSILIISILSEWKNRSYSVIDQLNSRTFIYFLELINHNSTCI